MNQKKGEEEKEEEPKQRFSVQEQTERASSSQVASLREDEAIP